MLHAVKAWVQQALGGKQAIKKVNDPYFGGKKSCDMNLHKQRHVQHNCVNSRECEGGKFREALLEDVSGCTKRAMGVNFQSRGI